ncbi:slit homolog 2 protein-like [Dreissena polymorpha]|uniref:Uncharacterized protein n=1 Tax=Dreissena polymorpha TaxID=45954 RepID=A0A9D4LAD7_DREPO|nr:slit homolog 2 protein-like [Dreissena polymorpha]KAH3854511.1 hypothetical protein DPMN_097054 [Dreissena polymorpha]
MNIDSIILILLVTLLTIVSPSYIERPEGGCTEKTIAQNVYLYSCSGEHVQWIPKLGAEQRSVYGLVMTNATSFTQINATSLLGFTALVELFVSNTGLSEIELGAFQHAKRLQKLVLLDNKLTRLPPGVFDGPDRLRYLDLTGNRLSTIDGILFGHPYIEMLMLDNNRLTSISLQDETGFFNLHHISIRNNSLLHGNFSNLSALKTLHLSHNRLTSIDGSFLGLSSLVELELDHNLLKKFHQDAFVESPALEHLKLGFNHLDEIEPGAFRNNLDLITLHCAHNRLMSVNNILPLDHTKFQVLNMSHNLLAHFPRFLPRSTSFLQLSSNSIKSITSMDTEHYINVTALVLDGNALTTVERGALAQMVSLRHVILHNNSLTVFPVPMPMSVKQVLLDNNNINEIPADVFASGTELDVLSIVDNNVSTIPMNMFRPIRNISQIHLGGNPITELKGNTFLFSNDVQVLSMNRLNLTAIHADCFQGLKDVLTLDLSFVQVDASRIHGHIFSKVPKLQNLIIQESPELAKYFIQSIAAGDFSLDNLKHLNLRNNKLNSIGDVNIILSIAGSLQSIDLHGNIFDCDENLDVLSLKILAGDHVVFRSFACKSTLETNVRNLGDVRSEDIYRHVMELLSASVSNSTEDPAVVSTTVYRNNDDVFDNDWGYFDIYDSQEHGDYKDIDLDKIAITAAFYETTHREDDETPDYDDPTKRSTYPISYHSTSIQSHERITYEVSKVTKQTTTLKAPIGPTQVTPLDDVTVIANQSKVNSSFKTIGISIGTALCVIIIMLLIALVVFKYCLKRHPVRQQNCAEYKLNGKRYVIKSGAASTAPIAKPETKVHRKLSRAERGSTTSRASEDITNQVDTTMKVYTLDVDVD